MKAKAVILPDGSISIITQEGTFDDGKERILRLAKELELEGVSISTSDKDFEQHRHDDQGQHIHQHEHN